MKIRELIEKIASKKNCVVHTPTGLPVVGKYKLPKDVAEFYTLCGGMDLFTDSDFPYKIVPPSQFVPSTQKIYGDGAEDFRKMIPANDPTNSCFVIAEDESGDCLVMDLEEGRNGFCYDGFHENYGSPGDMPIIALDFTELLNHLIKNEGKNMFWLELDFPVYGDAYDNKNHS